MMNDWKLWLLILQGLIILGNIGIFSIIKFNDLKHMGEAMKETSNQLKSIFRRLGKIEKNQAARNAVCDERHSKK